MSESKQTTMKTSATIRSTAILLFVIAQILGISQPSPALEFYYTILSNPNRVAIGARAVSQREGTNKITAAVAGEVTHNFLDTATNFTFLCAKEAASSGGNGVSNFFSVVSAQKATNYFMSSEFGEYLHPSDDPRTTTNGYPGYSMQKRIFYGIPGWVNPHLVAAEVSGNEVFSDYLDEFTGIRYLDSHGQVILQIESHGINEGFQTYGSQIVDRDHTLNYNPPPLPTGDINTYFRHVSWGTNFPSAWNYTNYYYYTNTANYITHTNTTPFASTNAKYELIRMPYVARISAVSNFSTFTAGSNYYGYAPQTQTSAGSSFRTHIGNPDYSNGTKSIAVDDREPVFVSTNLVVTLTESDPIGHLLTRPDARTVAWYGTNAVDLNAQGITEARQNLPDLGAGYQITGTNGSPGMNWSLVGYVDTFEVAEATPSLSEFLDAFGYSAIEDPDADSVKIQNFCFQVASKLGAWLERKEIWKEN